MSGHRIRLSTNVLLQRVNDEAVLLDLETRSYFGLDPIGTIIWEGIENNKSETEIVESITQRFAVEAEVACRDLREFLIELRDDGLIHLKEAH